jgi:putative Mg2+ transporter-C (MgtC) family protein
MISPLNIVLRICLATVLGAIVGVERERSERAAGLRTHAVVALGAAVFMLASAYGFKDVLGAPAVVLDPSRVAAQIVTGIGFLGAGAIIFQHEMVRGLTTAASIWVVAAIGMAVAGGMYVLSISGTGLTLLVLAALKRLENRWFRDRRSGSLNLRIDPNSTSIAQIRAHIEEQGLKVEQLRIAPGEAGVGDGLTLVLGRADKKKVTALLDRLRGTAGVREISLGSQDFRNA